MGWSGVRNNPLGTGMPASRTNGRRSTQAHGAASHPIKRRSARLLHVAVPAVPQWGAPVVWNPRIARKPGRVVVPRWRWWSGLLPPRSRPPPHGCGCCQGSGPHRAPCLGPIEHVRAAVPAAPHPSASAASPDSTSKLTVGCYPGSRLDPAGYSKSRNALESSGVVGH